MRMSSGHSNPLADIRLSQTGAALATDGGRLHVITGPPASGKTQLALQLAWCGWDDGDGWGHMTPRWFLPGRRWCELRLAQSPDRQTPQSVRRVTMHDKYAQFCLDSETLIDHSLSVARIRSFPDPSPIFPAVAGPPPSVGR